MWRKLMMVIAICGMTACSKSGLELSAAKEGPQKILSQYIATSFAMKSIDEKSKLLALTTGEVKSTLEGLNNETFKQQFIDSKRTFDAMKIKDERKIGEDRYSITYELSYTNASGDSKDKITNKKHAVFIKQDGKWYISEVKNLKTLIEHQNEISL